MPKIALQWKPRLLYRSSLSAIKSSEMSSRRRGGEILATESLSKKTRVPKIDDWERLATYPTVKDGDGDEDENGKVTAASLKKNMIEFFDKYLDAASP